MHISKISIVNFRNFAHTNFTLAPGVNTIIGENGSGKSNFFRAIRLLLDDTFATRRSPFREDDFHRGLGENWQGHWIVIKAEFSDVSDDEAMQSLLLQHTADDSTGSPDLASYALIYRPNFQIRKQLSQLSPGDTSGLAELLKTITLSDYERVLVGKMMADLSDPKEYSKVVGDFDKVVFPDPEEQESSKNSTWLGHRIPRDISLWREFSLSYVPALRDVLAEFRDPWRNPLQTLLNSKSEDIPEIDLDPLLQKVGELNKSIEGIEDIQDLTNNIHNTFKETVGETYSPTVMKIQSELPLDASKLFRSLKLYVGENGDLEPRKLHEMSLGGANLIYLSLKLLEFEYQSERQPIANFLLIEEPEAHIHAHVQKTLFEKIPSKNTQVIYSTHSTNISEVSDIKNVNVISREETAWVAMQPAAGLKDEEIRAAQRFLDAIRSNLLFARSVLLVEGDAEEILIPNLVKKIFGITLDEVGISIINVRSTRFENLANLFHEKRLRKKCAILTDLDSPLCGTVDSSNLASHNHTNNSARSGQRRKNSLDEYARSNPYVHVEYAEHTFEVDFAKASRLNRKIMVPIVREAYKTEKKQQEVVSAITSDNAEIYEEKVLNLARKIGKGWFALQLSNRLYDDNSSAPSLPNYILNGLGFAVGELPKETWIRIINHQLTSHTVLTDRNIADYLQGSIELQDLISELSSSLKNSKQLEQLVQAASLG
ncbi:ATP-dependent nuclease [Corynebacterium pseudogenitalium]|uniref:ATP-dependent nuclease n=1 Tax=Corynebacterium pseudogenitalium TaxID=38303 RepID=UPI003B9FF5E4